jgi:uncharacterized protein YgiM (DUF1202 family)
MQHMERPSTVIVVVVTLVLAGIVGLAIPFASGSRPSREPAAWKSPTPMAPTAPAPAASATASAMPSRTRAATSAPTASPTFKPPTATKSVDLTPSPSPTAESTPTQPPALTPTQPSRPPATAQPPAAATLPPGTPGTQLSAVVAVDFLNLRDGPGQGFGVIGLARSGETYTATARSGDSIWLQVCCFNQAPAWLASGMVTVTGSLDRLPVAP